MGNPSNAEVRLRVLASAAKESNRIAAEDREKRNRAIAEADAQGWGLREIARATGMSASHIQRIVGEQTADAQALELDEERVEVTA